MNDPNGYRVVCHYFYPLAGGLPEWQGKGNEPQYEISPQCPMCPKQKRWNRASSSASASHKTSPASVEWDGVHGCVVHFSSRQELKWSRQEWWKNRWMSWSRRNQKNRKRSKMGRIERRTDASPLWRSNVHMYLYRLLRRTCIILLFTRNNGLIRPDSYTLRVPNRPDQCSTIEIISKWRKNPPSCPAHAQIYQVSAIMVMSLLHRHFLWQASPG